MASSTNKEIEQAILDAINEDKELLAQLETIPEQVEETVRQLTPVLTGETKRSIEVKSRKTALKKLSTRRVKLGTVFSDDDPARVNSIECGRAETDKHGGTEEFAMFRRAAALWNEMDI